MLIESSIRIMTLISPHGEFDPTMIKRRILDGQFQFFMHCSSADRHVLSIFGWQNSTDLPKQNHNMSCWVILKSVLVDNVGPPEFVQTLSYVKTLSSICPVLVQIMSLSNV